MPKFVVVVEEGGVKHHVNREHITDVKDANGKWEVWLVTGQFFRLPESEARKLIAD